MKFWPRDAIERIQNEEDKLFLQSMMGDRTATLRSVDNVLANTENKVLRGRHREEDQRKKERSEETKGRAEKCGRYDSILRGGGRDCKSKRACERSRRVTQLLPFTQAVGKDGDGGKLHLQLRVLCSNASIRSEQQDNPRRTVGLSTCRDEQHRY